MNYVFTQKELSYLDDVLPGKQYVKKRKLTLKEIDVTVLEKARKDQNEMIKRKSVIPDRTRRAGDTDEGGKSSNQETEEGARQSGTANEKQNEDIKPFLT